MNNRLKELRTQRGIKQRELAVRSGIGAAMLSDIERYGYAPRQSTKERIAKALDVTVNEIWDEARAALSTVKPDHDIHNSITSSSNTYPNSPSSQNARIAAGLTLTEAARQLNLSPRYLRQIERHGNASMKTARRIARLYDCDANLFIFPPAYFSGQRTVRTSNASPAAGADTSPARASRRYSPPKTSPLTLLPQITKDKK